MPKASATTLEQIVRAYLDDLQIRAYRPKTINGYRKNLGTFLAWAATRDATTLAHFTPDLVKAHIRYLQQKPKWSQRGYRTPQSAVVGASAIRNYIGDLKTFASWLDEEQYTPGNTPASVKVPKADETPIEPFTDDDLARTSREPRASNKLGQAWLRSVRSSADMREAERVEDVREVDGAVAANAEPE